MSLLHRLSWVMAAAWIKSLRCVFRLLAAFFFIFRSWFWAAHRCADIESVGEIFNWVMVN